jgi:hypothetical protein
MLPWRQLTTGLFAVGVLVAATALWGIWRQSASPPWITINQTDFRFGHLTPGEHRVGATFKNISRQPAWIVGLTEC